MLVKDTVLKMMRYFPQLYPTRVDALLRLFDSFDTKWVNGELVDLEAYDESFPYLSYSAEEVADPTDDRKLSDVIANRWENAKAQFVHDNAYLMALDPFSHFRSDKTLSFEGNRFRDIPADITEDWMDAAKELARAVMAHKYFPKRQYAPQEVERQRDAVAASAKICEQFLERFKVITPCPYARAARVKELQREALALGLNLTEADGTPPKSAVF